MSLSCNAHAGLVDALEAGEHDLSIERWAELLASLDPADYLDPAGKPVPSHVLTRRARCAVLEERHARGEQLWSPNDVLPNKEQMAVAVVVGHGDNGEDRDDETLTTTRAG